MGHLVTFPHGGVVSAGLLLVTSSAFITTAYSMASCRFVVLTYTSNAGNFEESFSTYTGTTDSPVQYKVGIGLFHWLQPNVSENWEEGICVGYEEMMKEQFSDSYFEMARAAGSLSVLLSVFVVLWSLLGSCLAWNMWQIMILAVLLLGGTISSGLCFIFFKSDLCNNIFEDSSCKIDEGGLVLVAGAILWFASFFITAIFMRTLDVRMDDNGLSDAERARARELSMNVEKRARDKEQRERQRAEDQARQLMQGPTMSFEKQDVGVASLPAVYVQEEHGELSIKDDDDEYEVYISGTGETDQKIDEILQDLEHSHSRQNGGKNLEP